jgi:hypothetical protein
MTLFNGLIPSSASQQTQQTMTYRMLKFQYGNGYEARSPDGANPKKDTWQISFDTLDAAQSTLLESWLGLNPSWVSWNGDGTILPSSKTYWLTESGYIKTPMPGNVNAYTFNIEQSF